MPRKKLPYKIKHRILSNGKESKEYYAQVPNERGKKIWLKLGTNYKEAEKKLSEELIFISELRMGFNYEQELAKNSETDYYESFLAYLKRNHYFEPEENAQYVFYKRTGTESYGLNHSKQVAAYFHRLFDEDKGNDEIGKKPFRAISHKDAKDLWKRLEASEYFTTNSVRNRLLDILSSTYKFIMKDEKDIPENPFRSIAPFREKKDDEGIRIGMSKDQVHRLFADEETINTKVVEYLIRNDEEETARKIGTIEQSTKSEAQKRRLISDLKTWNEKKKESFRSYKFTETQYYRYFRFMLGTGLRGAECRALQYNSFTRFPYVLIDKGFKEANSKRESIEEPKWGRKRIVFMCDTLQKMMSYARPVEFDPYSNEHIFSNSPTAFVFSQDGGRSPLCANELRRKWTMFVCAMGFKPHIFTPHSLRHTIAAMMMENGVPEWLVVKWCGWETSSVSKMVNNYANKNWNYEYPEFKEIVAPLIEEIYFTDHK